jgi:hypothetical protein
MLRLIERTLDADEELCVCFIDWQTAFDRVNWNELMQILKVNGIGWRERRLISKLYMDQCVKVRLNRGETRSVNIGRGVRQGCCLLPVLFNLYSEYLINETVESRGNFIIGRQVNRAVKCVDELVLLAKETAVLRGVIERTIGTGRK